MKQSAHCDLVDEATQQISAAIQDVGDSTTITRAFEMCRVGNWNLSQPSLMSPEALAGLCNLQTINPALHAALSQTTETDPTSEAPDNGDGDDPYQGADVYDDCDIHLAVVSDHLLSGGSSIADNFAVGENGGTVQSGDAETSDAEEESDAPVVLGLASAGKSL
ncbi:hypothetical protein B0H10DRAFT_2206309 [Mycena sp. CBHHK59/15]|nr:hypothetical protein B0H10DRAFT_2206309 [Mycena sp. CBHHK59/15]